MSEDTADFQAFATAAMAQAAGTDPVLVAPVAETPPVEAKPDDKPVEAKPEPKVDEVPAWKKAADAEKAKRAANNNSKATEQRLNAQLQQVQAKLARFEAIEAKKATDPLGAAEEFGLSYDTLTKKYLETIEDPKAGPAPEVKALIQKIQHVEDLLKTQQQAIERRAQTEAVQSFVNEVKQVLEAKGDEFELVRAARQGPDLVREIVGAHFRATAQFDAAGNILSPGEIMPTEDACRLAEKYLDEDLGQFRSTKKFAGKPETPKVEAPKPKAEAPTLSQDMRQGGTKPEPHGDEIEQLLLLKKTLESQLDAQQGT